MGRCELSIWFFYFLFYLIFFYLNFFIFKLFLLAMLFLSVTCVIIKLILEILSRQELLCKIAVLKNFANFTGKYLCLTVFLNKFVTLQAVCQNISENFFLRNGCEQLLLRIPSKLTHLMLLVSFYTSWKNQETTGFLMLSGGVER